jgi:hypothetical protein
MKKIERRSGRKAGPGGPRGPLHITVDGAVRGAADALAERLGVPLARVVDVALRAELARHGVELQVPVGVDAALEETVQRARLR